jgi:hypothetical protein
MSSHCVVSGLACNINLCSASGQRPRPNRRNAPHSTLSVRPGNCTCALHSCCCDNKSSGARMKHGRASLGLLYSRVLTVPIGAESDSLQVATTRKPGHKPGFFAQNRPIAFSPISHRHSLSQTRKQHGKAQSCDLSHARLLLFHLSATCPGASDLESLSFCPTS